MRRGNGYLVAKMPLLIQRLRPPDPVAPMEGDCPSCGERVGMLRPRVVDLVAGQYVIAGECAECDNEVRIRLP